MIASLPIGVFVLMQLFVLAMAGILVYAGLRARRRAALVRSMPTSPIGMAEDGYREVEGTVEAVPGPPLLAPLTRQPCCWYEAKVEKYVVRGSTDTGSEGRWETVTSETSAAPFLVRDGTGVCLVDPHRAEVTPTDRSQWYGNTATPKDRNPPKVGPTEALGGMLQSSGSNRFRYYEARIYSGNPALVLGEFASHRFDASEDAGDADEVEGAEAKPAGDASPSARIAALERDDAMLDAARRVTRQTIARGTGARPFIITTTSQAQHVALSSQGGVAALGLALVPLALAALLVWLRYG